MRLGGFSRHRAVASHPGDVVGRERGDVLGDRGAGGLARRRDEDRVVAGDGAHDAGQHRLVEGGGEELRRTRRRLQDDVAVRGAHGDEELLDPGSQTLARAVDSGVERLDLTGRAGLGQDVDAATGHADLRGPHLAEVAGQGALTDDEPLPREHLLELGLAVDPHVADERGDAAPPRRRRACREIKSLL